MLGSSNSLPTRETRVLLLLARPSHELLVYGWMEQLHPLVLVLTDGSDSRGAALASTTSTIRSTGSRIGGLFGRFTDRGLLQSVYMHNHERFIALAEELADLLVAEGIDWIMGEAGEGHSATADVCRILLDAASGLVSRRLAHLRNYDFSLRADRRIGLSRIGPRQLELDLEDETWERKRQAILATPGMGHRLQQSEDELRRWRREILHVTQPWQILRLAETTSVEYQADYDSSKLGFHEHILPLAEALRLTACRRAVA